MKNLLFKRVAAGAIALAAAAGILAFAALSPRADEYVLVDENYFPDMFFREWIQKQPYGKDDLLTEAEIASIKSINVRNESIYDFTGIEYLTSLEELDCSDTEATSLDLSKNTALKVLNCYSCPLKSLDVSKCTALENLNCNRNKLSILDLSNNTALKELDCSYNDLIGLDLSKNTALLTLDCSYNKLKSLDASKCTTLQTLNCSANKLTALDVNGCTALNKIDCSENQLTSLNVSGCTSLNDLYCSENQITSLDLSSCSSINSIKCSKNKLTSLKVINLSNLEKLTCDNNQLTGLDVSGCSSLKGLECYYNQLTSLDISNCPSLYYLCCSNNETLKDIDFGKSSALSNVECINIGIENLDLSNCPELLSLYCGDSNLTKLDISKCLKLNSLSCTETALTSLDLSNNAALEFLDCHDNLLSELDVSKAVALDYLDCKNNKLTNLDVSKNTLLKTLICTNNNLTNLDVSKAPLDLLHCASNELKSLKIGGGRIGFLICNDNNLSELDIINCTLLIDAYKNGTVTRKDNYVKYHVDADRDAYFDGADLTVDKDVKIIYKTDGLKLDKNEASVVCGKSLTLKATVKDDSLKVKWTSSNKDIATVDKNGKIKAKMAGKVCITASTDNADVYDECIVTVLYKDVTSKKDFWYTPTYYLTEKNVVKGYDKQTKFKPKNDCTRAQMVTFLWRLNECPVNSTWITHQFKDVKLKDYFCTPVYWALHEGITTGVSKEKFDPQGVCTRAQTVTFLWRMANKPEPEAKTCKFKDVKEKDYFYKPVIWASEQKIVAGYKDGTFKPKGKCLRRQMVTFLYKYDKFVNKKG